MDMDLTIIRIKPNPSGKDRPAFGGPSPAQLAAEWVDFRNDSGRTLTLDGVALYHVVYPAGGNPSWSRIVGFQGSLKPSEIVRVHSGRKRELTVIRQEDLAGAHHHVFTGDDAYVWNNRQGDRPRLLNETTNKEIDQTWYAPKPPEGAVLVRVGEQLIVAQNRAVNW
jgi:hypothetical protein